MKNVLVPMRKVPLAWCSGRVIREIGRTQVEVAIPHNGRNLYQVFNKEDIIFVS